LRSQDFAHDVKQVVVPFLLYTRIYSW